MLTALLHDDKRDAIISRARIFFFFFFFLHLLIGTMEPERAALPLTDSRLLQLFYG